jgi:hypothetical protein
VFTEKPRLSSAPPQGLVKPSRTSWRAKQHRQLHINAVLLSERLLYASQAGCEDGYDGHPGIIRASPGLCWPRGTGCGHYPGVQLVF